MNAVEAIRTRRSVRQFEATVVDKESLETIVDCGRLAATARNEQPWEFVIITEAAKRRRIADITDHGKFIAEAGACIAVLCADTKYYLEDGAAATQNILIAAHASGLAACWVAGDKKEYCGQILQVLNAPPQYRLVSLVAIGRAKSVPTPSKRRLEDVLHWETF